MTGPVVPPGGEDKIPNWFGILGDRTRPPVDGEGVWTPPATIGGRWARTNRSTGLYETWAGPEDDARLLAESAQRARATVPPGGEELREAMLGAICRCLGMDPAEADQPEVDDLMEHLIPEVLAAMNREGRRRAAEVLRAAAAEQRAEAENVPDTDEGTHADGHRCAATFLDRRAAALAPENARPE